MKIPDIKSAVLSQKKYLPSYFLITIISVFTLLNYAHLVTASFGTWGDSSLIHACKNSRGGVALVGSSDSCNGDETQVTWLKDVDAGAGLNISRSSSGATLSLANNDGWMNSSDTWTYASAQSFTVPGDQTAKYQKGTRLKFTQTTVKYGFVVSSSYSSPNTTVTIATNTDYTIANASITNPAYSYQDKPQGYPYTFDFSPSITNGSVGNGTMNAHISSNGNKAIVDIKWTFGSTSSVTGTISFAGIPSAVNGDEIGTGFFYHNASSDVVIGSAVMAAGDLYPKINSQPFNSSYGTVWTNAPFTWGTNDELRLHYEYQF
jgi:hypothetical protein